MLFERSLIADTKGESIFHTVKEYFKKKNIPVRNIMSIAIDEALSITGCLHEFIALLKEKVSGILSIHSVIHK